MKEASPTKRATLFFETDAPSRLTRPLSDLGRVGSDRGLRPLSLWAAA
jgi:hypothetical protein